MKSTRGASRTTGGQTGRQKESAMRILALVVALAAAALPMNAAAQAGTSNNIDVKLAPGDSATIKVAVEPGTALVVAPPPAAPKPPAAVKADPKAEEANCKAGGGTWDGTKPTPATPSDVDARCDLSGPNAGKTTALERVGFCNDPDLLPGLQPDKKTTLTLAQAKERFVVGEWQCTAWAARRAADRRVDTKIKTAMEALKLPPPVDLVPVTDRLTAAEDAQTKLRAETVRLDGEIKKFAEQLKHSSECEELATKGAALLDEVATDGTMTGQAKFEKCLADPKTHPTIRIAILGVRVAQRKAEEALAAALAAQESAARAVHLGIAYVLGGALTQPTLEQGKVVRRGGNNLAPAGLAFLLHAQKLHLDVTIQVPLIEQLRDSKGVPTTAYGAGGSIRVAYVWTPDGWPSWLLIGPALTLRVQGTNFLATAPLSSAFAFGAGVGGRLEVVPADSAFRLALDLDPLAWDWVSGTVDGKSVRANGYAFPLALKAGFVF